MTVQIPATEQNILQFVSTADELRKHGHAQWAEYVGSRKFVHEAPMPSDCFSPDYLEAQLELWRLVSGRRSYEVEVCEANNNLDSINSITETYPFASKNPTEIKNYFSAIMAMLEHLDAPPPAEIVEFGVGWGHSSRFLSNCGYNVTVLDIERRFLDLVPKFSLPGATPIKLVHSAFTGWTPPPASFDRAIFFECFHHCLDHEQLIENLSKALKPGGKIIFCAESFYDEWFDFPWGLRLDGHSVWAIRNFGWMELGFRKSYISGLLEGAGFELAWSRAEGIGAYGEFLVATLRS